MNPCPTSRAFRHLLPIAITGLVCCAGFSHNSIAADRKAEASESFILVKDAQPLASVVLPADATPRNREAANELVAAIRAISGAELKIIEATPSNPPERGVWIGLQPGMATLFPDTNLELTKPEEIVIATGKNHLLIAGRDRFDRNHMSVAGTSQMIEGKQQEYGTANSVYTFLQEFLGVRWLLPGPLGADYPKTGTITIPPTNLRYHPQFRLRMGIFAPHEEGKIKRGNEMSEWARRQRLLLDSLDVDGGHAFVHWWEKYGSTRPELFALQPDGTRGTAPDNPRCKKICEGEPAVWDLWLEEASESLKANPNKVIFNVAANDNWSTGHCVDPRSQAWDPPIKEGTKLTTFFYKNDQKLERPLLADRYVTFANKLGQMLKEKYPGRELYVSQLAYGDTGREAPVSAVPDDNVIIVSVHSFLFRGKLERDEQMKMFEDWSKLAKQIIWRPNMGGSSGWHWGTPDVGFDRAAHDFKWVAEHGTIGIFIDMVWDHWGTQGPLFYLMAQLAWNPYGNADEILKDFCDRSYGPAGATMLTYWRLMESMRDKIEDESPTRWRMLDSPAYYTEAFFKQAQALLDQAAGETKGAPEKYQGRIALVQAGLDYTELVIDTRAAMQQWEKSNKTDEKAKAHVIANWAKTDEMKKTFPDFAISWSRAMRNDVPAATQSRRMYGLHPDLVLTGSKLKEYLDGASKSKDELE